MPADAALIDWVEEALAPVGTVTHRPMMGGATLYCDGTVFAIVLDDQLWLKADATSDAIWDAEGCARFTYEMGEGRSATMNYRAAPAATYDDADVLREWAALAIAAGERGPARRPRKRR